MKKIFLPAMLLLSITTFFSSCLKDKGFEDGTYGIPEIGDGKNLPKVIEIPSALVSPVTIALNTLPAVETVDLLELNLALGVPATEDIEITLVKNMTLVADYNTANGTTYIELPANCYTIKNPNGLKVTIPKGTNRVALKADIIKGNFDFSKAYALGYTITSVSPAGYVISQNFKNVIVSVGVKNKYDGIYSMKFRIDQNADRPATWGYGTYVYPYAIHLVTSGPASAKMFNTAFGAGFHPLFSSPTTVSGFGSTEPQFTFNASDGLANVVNSFPNPSNGRGFILNSAITNSRYDAATKTLYAAIKMTQPGFTDLPCWDTLSYVSPR